MKKLIFTWIFALSGMVLQVNAQEVISSAGEHASVQNIQISWTLGETVIETITGDGNILTQGFHQTKLVLTPVLSFPHNYKISVFPNPVSEEVFIQLQGSQMLNTVAGLYTLHGEMVKQVKITDEKTAMNVLELPNGSYLLKISEGAKPLETFKLVKIY